MGILSTIAKIIAPDDGLSFYVRARQVGDGTDAPAVSGATHPFLRGEDIGPGGETLTNPYAESAWVGRALKLVYEPITAAPLRFSEQSRGAEKLYQSDELSAFWEFPAVGPEGPISRADWITASVGWLKLAGEAFFLLDDEWLLPRGRRRPFIIARPDRMTEILSPTGTVDGWRFSDGRGRSYTLLAEQVIHVKYWNPYSEVRGCPEYLAARLAAEADHAAARFARDLARNNGDRGPIVSPRDPTRVLTQAQQDQITLGLRAKRDAAKRGEFRPVFLAGAVSVENPAPDATDTKFIAQRVENRKEIFVAFGVPASMAEAVATYSVGSASDRYRLVEDTCIPTSEKLSAPAASISRSFERRPAGRVLYAWFDFSDHSTMREARRESVDALVKLTGTGMPVATAGQYLGLGLPRFPGDDVGHLPAVAGPAVGAPPALPSPAKTEPAPGPAPDVGAAALARLFAPAPDGTADALGKLLSPEVSRSKTLAEEDDGEPDRAALWQERSERRRGPERAMLAKVRRCLNDARTETLRKLERLGKATAGVPVQREDRPNVGLPVDPVGVLFDLPAFETALLSALEKVQRTTFDVAGREVFADVGTPDNAWTMPPEAALDAVRARENLIRGAGRGVFEEIRAELAEGFQAGDTTAELATRVRAKFNELSKGRATTIAVTETGAAYGSSQAVAQRAAGVKKKQWLSARDGRVRTDHQDADGQTVGVDESFTVGGEPTPYPCGPGLSARQAAGCRCLSISVIEED